MGTIGDIRTNFEMAMLKAEARLNEALSQKTTKDRQPFWDSYFKNVSTATIPINTKAKELIRATFGANDGKVAEENITKMFNGAGVEISEIQFNDKGVLRTNGLGSNDYPTYKVITKDGDEYFVTNNVVELEDGGVSEIGKKVTNPSSLGLADTPFTNVNTLLSAIEKNLNTKTWSAGTKSYMLGLAKSVAEGANNSFADMQAFWDAGEISENIDAKYVDPNFNIDERSLRNIINDFGEVLDGVYIVKTVKNLGTSLVFPGSGNEALADLYVEPWAISSKAKKGGGKPSINALVSVCKDNAAAGNKLNAADVREQELYDMMISFGNIIKGNKLPTVESYILAANVLIKNGLMKNSGFEYFLEVSGLDINNIDRTDIMSFLESLATTDPEKFDAFILEYRKRTGVNPTQKMTAESFLKNPIGDGFYYPFAVEIAKILNNNYQEALKSLINKFLVVKQMYFGVDIKRNTISIRSTSSDTIKAAAFMARGSAKTFNAGLAYEMK